MELTFDLFEQLVDLYNVKSRHIRYLNSMLPTSWQATIPGGYGNIWERREWKFYLKEFEPFPACCDFSLRTSVRYWYGQ